LRGRDKHPPELTVESNLRHNPKLPKNTKIHVNSIQALSFDLDNTLWEIGPVMVRAEQILLSWFKDNFPAHANQFKDDEFRQVRIQIGLEYPEYSHDFTILRKLSLERLLQTYGYEKSWVEDAMEVFLSARNRVTLYRDVLPCLETLTNHFPIICISNGNADVRRIGIDHFFQHSIHARHIGVSKPDTKIFRHACEQLRVDPSAVLHVGDHPIEDIQGAAQAGLRTAWINRDNSDWDYDHNPDYMFRELESLTNELLKN